MNYFVVHKQSNLIVNVISTSGFPQTSTEHKFIRANDKSLDVYHLWLAKHPDLCPDIGDIAVKAPYLQQESGKVKYTTTIDNRRYR
ncbi:hypothetical protein ACSVIJ_07225 [Pseudomonas sp. NCHU5208]|uniref:hypothetical protein n=1 Tax=unclassified Pseudomonas TaxID=196821 RepID=UPI003F9AD8DB